jgi:preprotein translocase subunit YajC
VTKAPTKDDPEVTVEIADDVQVKVIKSTLSQVRAKSQPVDSKSDKS